MFLYVASCLLNPVPGNFVVTWLSGSTPVSHLLESQEEKVECVREGQCSGRGEELINEASCQDNAGEKVTFRQLSRENLRLPFLKMT